MRQQSKKRRAERAQRQIVVEACHMRDGYRCRAADVVPRGPGYPADCSGPADCHEIIPRSAWRAGYLVLANCLTVCRRHHEWIDNNPDEAHTFGLHGFSWERPGALGYLKTKERTE